MPKTIQQLEIKEGEKNQQLPLPEKVRRPRSVKEEFKGSRWASLVLLFITMIISVLFYLQGMLMKGETTTPKIDTSSTQGFFGTKTYRFEK